MITAENNREELKKNISAAMYDILILKGHSAAQANAIVKNALSREENITEYALARLLVRLEVAHANRARTMPGQWADMLRQFRARMPDTIKQIAEEVRISSTIDRARKITEGKKAPHEKPKPTHKKPR